MPFKDPEAKRLWRIGYRPKQRAMTRAWTKRQSELRRPERERIRREKEEAVERAETLKLVYWAMGEVRRRIMLRDGLKWCNACKRALPIGDFSPSRQRRASSECR